MTVHKHAQGAVVPGVGEAAVDLATGEDEATALAQGNELVHGLFRVVHNKTSFLIFTFAYIPTITL